MKSSIKQANSKMMLKLEQSSQCKVDFDFAFMISANLEDIDGDQE